MLQIYLCIGMIIFFLALSVGLISGIHFRPPEIYTDQEIYRFAGEVTVGIVILTIGIIFLLVKTRHIKLTKKLVENLKEEGEK